MSIYSLKEVVRATSNTYISYQFQAKNTTYDLKRREINSLFLDCN